MRGVANFLVFLSILGTATFPALASADLADSNSICADHPDLQSNLRDVTRITDQVSTGITASGSVYTKLAAIYGVDDRRIPNGADYPWRAYGKLDIPYYGHCTTVMVSACHAVTVGHCVAYMGKDGKMAPKFLKDAMPDFVSANGKTRAKLETSSAAEADYDREFKADTAFIKLDKPIGKELGWVGVADKKPQDLMGFQIFGYGFSKSGYMIAGFNGDIRGGDVLSVDENVTMLKGKDGLIQYRANTFSGASGAPVVQYNSKGEPEIVGLNTRALVAPGIMGTTKQVTLPADETTKLATGIASHEFAADLLKFIHDNPCDLLK